ncbi:MAG: hypothetical protein MO846_10165 [Candidatus Devosia symbiotica]|nr:hypothetical protein [Candidatus Devosia symbiotica]
MTDSVVIFTNAKGLALDTAGSLEFAGQAAAIVLRHASRDEIFDMAGLNAGRCELRSHADERFVANLVQPRPTSAAAIAGIRKSRTPDTGPILTPRYVQIWRRLSG